MNFFGDNNIEEHRAAEYLIKNNNLQLVALHDEMTSELNQIFKINNTITVNNGINLDLFLKASKDDFFKRKLGIPLNSFVVGHIGRFAEQKNHKFLVRVFEAVVKQKPNAFLLMIGSGELESVISGQLNSKGLQNRYLILPHRIDIPELMKIMNVFLFPSLFEGLGIVLIEAQAARLKCVISDTIPKAATVSNYVTALSLEDELSVWTEAVLASVPNEFEGDFSDWDIKRVVKKLERIYD